MRNLRLALLLLLPALLAALPASARDIRFPEKGNPAYSVMTPDDWITEPVEGGNLLLISPKRTAVIVILVAKSDENLDDIARDGLVIAKAAPSHRKEPAEISGHKGSTYFSTLTNEAGVRTDLEMTLVKVGAHHIAGCTLILSAGLSKEDETAARLVRNGMKLSGPE